ncbi:VOC family protein [Babesia caballi]|uniref:VOC family protein n=1 Tax=Babesia caballi TaxID=5871 RepID=A0AAV4LXE1_BABCB|nr:VOC family protein [Babesia caballi]
MTSLAKLNANAAAGKALAAYEPPPFDFEAIDDIVRSQQPGAKRGLNVDNDEKSLLYLFLREANAAVYAATALSKKGELLTPADSAARSASKGGGQGVCDRIQSRLLDFKLDNRIIVLQRALAAWHHAAAHHWHRLAKTALRSCLVHDEALTAEQLVRICAALSKWRFRNLAEVQRKLDLAIMAEGSWDVYQASQLLWSLAHLRTFDVCAFDYMNNVIACALREGAVDVATMPDDTIHRILNANLIRMSHTGHHHRVVTVMVDSLEASPCAISHLSPKTILAVTAVLPLCRESGIAAHIARRMSQSMHKFTHAQAAHLFYNLAIVAQHLPVAVMDQLVGALFEFKEMLYKAEAAYVPSLTAKLLFTFRVLLPAFDHCFVSKCLADLSANLHLLGPFSLVGNLQCIALYREETAEELSEKQCTSLRNTWRNIARVDGSGNFVKPLYGETALEPVENLKLWHYGALRRLTKYGHAPMMDKLSGFTDRCDEGSLMSATKDFLLFLVNAATQRDLSSDGAFLNSVLIVGSQLWQMSVDRRVDVETWDAIRFHLAALGLLDAFERECSGSSPRGDDVGQSQSLLGILRMMVRSPKSGDTEKALVKWLRDRAAVANDADIARDALAVRFLLFMGISHRYSVVQRLEEAGTSQLAQILTESFYGASGPVFETHKSTDRELSNVLDYLNKSLQVHRAPINRTMAYTRAFFMQDTPRLLMPLIPKLALAELCPQKQHDVALWDVAMWLLEEKQQASLARYLESVGEPRPTHPVNLVELASWNGCPAFDIKMVRRNFNFGPYMCHLGLFGENKTRVSLVFLNDACCGGVAGGRKEHLFDKQRRDALKNMGVQFLEFAVDNGEHNVV